MDEKSMKFVQEVAETLLEVVKHPDAYIFIVADANNNPRGGHDVRVMSNISSTNDLHNLMMSIITADPDFVEIVERKKKN